MARLVANPAPREHRGRRSASRQPGRRMPCSVTIASSRMSCSAVRHRRHLLRGIGEAERGHRPPRPQRGDGAVVEAAAVAEPVPARVEGEQRHQQHVRLRRLARRPAPRPRRRRAPSPPPASRSGTPAAGRGPRSPARRAGSRARPAPASPAAGRSRCGSADSPRPPRPRAAPRSPRAHGRPPAAPRRRPRRARPPAPPAPRRARPACSSARLAHAPEGGKRRARRDRGGVQSLRAWLTRWAPGAIGQGQSQSRLPQECLRPLGFGPLTGRPEPATGECSAPARRFEARQPGARRLQHQHPGPALASRQPSLTIGLPRRLGEAERLVEPPRRGVAVGDDQAQPARPAPRRSASASSRDATPRRRNAG